MTNELLSYYSNTKEKMKLKLRYKSQYCPNNYLDLMMQSVEQLYIHHPICSLLPVPISVRRLNLSHGERWICSAVQRMHKAPNQVIIVTPIPETFQKKPFTSSFFWAINIFCFFFHLFIYFFTTVKSLTNNHFTPYSSSIKAITSDYVIN